MKEQQRARVPFCGRIAGIRTEKKMQAIVCTLSVERGSGKMGPEKETVQEAKEVQNNRKEANSILGLREPKRGPVHCACFKAPCTL